LRDDEILIEGDIYKGSLNWILEVDFENKSQS